MTDKECSEQPCAGRQGCSTPLGVYVLGEIGPDPTAQERQGCHSSVPPGPSESKVECVFPVGRHTQNTHTHHTYTYMHIKIHKWLAIQIPRPHGLSAVAGTPLVPPTASFSHGLTLRDSHIPLAQRQLHPLASLICTRTHLPTQARSICWPHRHMSSHDPWSHSSCWHLHPLTPFSPVAATTDTQGLQPVLTGHRAWPVYQQENYLDKTSTFYPLIPLFSHTCFSPK